MPTRVPAYVTSLVRSGGGASLGTSSQDGSKTASFSGELRLIVGGQTDLTSSSGTSTYVFLGGNVNHNSTSQNPLNPDWVAAGLGHNWTHTNPFFAIPLLAESPMFDIPSCPGEEKSNTYSWGQLRIRAGAAQNRIPTKNQNVNFFNLTESIYFPLQSVDALRPCAVETGYGAPVYGAVTFGGQIQDRLNTSTPVPRSFVYWRFDLYAYPLIWAKNINLLKDTELNFANVTSTVSREVASQRGGHIWSAGFNWMYRKIKPFR